MQYTAVPTEMMSVFPVFQAQRVAAPTEVTGYLQQDVLLPCQFIPGQMQDNVTQVQWGFKGSAQSESVLLVAHYQFGVKVHDTFLKDKVAIQEQSLLIRDLAERDAGVYACKISAFPSGSFEAAIRLSVEGKRRLQRSQLGRPSWEDWK